MLSPSGSQSMVPGPAASALPENLLKVQILKPQSRPTESETLGVVLSIFVLTSPLGESEGH